MEVITHALRGFEDDSASLTYKWESKFISTVWGVHNLKSNKVYVLCYLDLDLKKKCVPCNPVRIYFS